jgi:BirA family biotin operon repressor/biotin-[acetyl-CoA-carboxylase] ligase
VAEQSARRAAGYDGREAALLARTIGVPCVEVYDEVGSTLDVAHALGAARAAAGTLILAEVQTAGRGRLGRSWRSQRGRGIWLTLLERPLAAALDVLPLRIGIRAARVLDAYADGRVGLKWPNDLYLGARKLGGVLAEARWRDGRLEWLAVGLGINVSPPTGIAAAALRAGSSRAEVLERLVPELRVAVATIGDLTDLELAEFGARDVALGRSCVEPAAGIVRGIDRRGALLVETDGGERAFRAGSLDVTDWEREGT